MLVSNLSLYNYKGLPAYGAYGTAENGVWIRIIKWITFSNYQGSNST